MELCAVLSIGAGLVERAISGTDPNPFPFGVGGFPVFSTPSQVVLDACFIAPDDPCHRRYDNNQRRPDPLLASVTRKPYYQSKNTEPLIVPSASFSRIRGTVCRMRMRQRCVFDRSALISIRICVQPSGPYSRRSIQMISRNHDHRYNGGSYDIAKHFNIAHRPDGPRRVGSGRVPGPS